LHDFGDRLYVRDAFNKQTGKRFKTQQALPNNPGLIKHAPILRVCRAHTKSQRSRSTFDQQAPASAQHLGAVLPQRSIELSVNVTAGRKRDVCFGSSSDVDACPRLGRFSSNS
jgi:hypothetical protein